MVHDVVIVGGGIIGLATARELLLRRPDLRLAVLEKEPHLARHQTGHNSGVIHSGIYYRPGSLKAALCVAGARMMVEFCQRHGIPTAICGKLIVAVEEAELPRLRTLHGRGVANGVAGLTMIGPERIRELEPHARGLKALHVPTAGVVDYSQVAQVLAEEIRRLGGEIRTSTAVRRCLRQDGGWVLETAAGTLRSRVLLTCGGLQSDRLSLMGGGPDDLRIIPFRGEYYDLLPERCGLVKSMIYPVPDPALPFLGVHFTRSITGRVHAGPNAVLALKREGYRKRDVALRDVARMLAYPGFWRMAARFWRTGLEEEWRSLSKTAFVHALRRMVPEVHSRDLVPGGSGVRAQAVDRQGRLLDDFDIVQAQGAVHPAMGPPNALLRRAKHGGALRSRVGEQVGGMSPRTGRGVLGAAGLPAGLHVRNVPSPAATASLRIAQHIAELAEPAIRAALPTAVSL